MIDRAGAEALMPEEAAREIIQGAVEQSAVLALGTRLPNMNRQQRRLPVLASLPTAYFLNAEADPSDTAYKKTTNMAWANKYINAEELAVIVPIPENVLDDSDYDIWGEVRPRVVEALGVAIDLAVFYGINAPAIWPQAIVTAATTAGNVIALGTNGDLYDDIMAEGGVISLVEEDGYMVNGHVAAMSMRAALRGLRTQDGIPIFTRSMQEGNRYELDGEPMLFPRNGAVDPDQSLLISGDWKQLVYAIRKDVTTKLLTEAVIQDPATGDIVYNLAQQDMVALRVVMRLGWQVPNPINRLQQVEAQRYPFAVLTPPSNP
jgi:HK97 family phage major capsid protein